MKRILSIGLLIILSYLLQTTLFQFLSFSQVTPNILLILTVSFAIVRGRTEGALIGFFSGLLCDIFFGSALGFYALTYTYIGYLNGYINRMYFRENLFLPMLMVFLSDFAYNLFIYIVTFLLRGKTDLAYYLLHTILPELIYTSVLGIFLYRGILYINDWLEEDEKGVL